MEEDLFTTASKAHISSETDMESMRKAEALYRIVLKSQPLHADCLHQLGALLVQIHNLQDSSTSSESFLGLEEPRTLLIKAINLQPQFADYRHSLGMLYLSSDQLPEAIEAFERSVENDPASIKFLLSLARACVKEAGRACRAAECFAAITKLDPTHSTAWYELAGCLKGINGQSTECIEAYRAHLDLCPSDERACFWMGVASGDGSAQMPHNLVADLFNSYADRFDEHLVSKLEYKTPGMLWSLVSRSRGQNPLVFKRAVDLGCGTGLMAPLMQDHVEWLEGVDLSEGMVSRARERDLYDRLVVGDLVSHLVKAREAGETFDLIISADTLVYFGALEPVFGAVNRVATPGALFAFSVEALEAYEAETTGYKITPSGRFAHSSSYIQELSKEYRWHLLSLERHVIRKNAGQDVVGWLVVLEKE